MQDMGSQINELLQFYFKLVSHFLRNKCLVIFRDWSPIFLISLLTVAFRWPIFLNAGLVNSDIARDALQARHMLQGEWSPFLWGAGFRGSIDPMIMALAFKVFGDSPQTLLVTQFAALPALLFFIYQILRRHLSSARASILLLLLFFAPQPLHGFVLFATRSWAMVVMMAAISLIDGADRSRWPSYRLGIGVFLALVSALYLDLFLLLLLPALAVFVSLSCLSTNNSLQWGAQAFLRLKGVLIADAAAFFFALVIRLIAPYQHATKLGFSATNLAINSQIFFQQCLPQLLNLKNNVLGDITQPAAWVAASLFLLTLLIGGLSFWSLPKAPLALKRLGIMGLVVTFSTFAGFLVSRMPIDMWSARYLAPILWFAPLTAAPLAACLKKRFLLILILPFSIMSGLNAWHFMKPCVDGIRPVYAIGQQVKDDRILEHALLKEGVRYATADYWTAYRLTFLFHEKIIVVPLDPQQDYYQPYREAYGSASKRALIFDSSETRALPGPYEDSFKKMGTPYRKQQIQGYTVLFVGSSQMSDDVQ